MRVPPNTVIVQITRLQARARETSARGRASVQCVGWRLKQRQPERGETHRPPPPPTLLWGPLWMMDSFAF